MEYWKAFENLNKLMENDFWKGDHVPPSTSAEPWLEYIYIVKIILTDNNKNDKIEIQPHKGSVPTHYFKIGFSNNDTNNVEISRRIRELDSEFGKVRLLYRWRLPTAQKYENSIKDFLINFRYKEKESGCIKKLGTTQNPKGFTEIIYNIPITTLVHTIQLCIIYHSLKNYLTDKSNSGALSIMTVSPTSIQDESEHTFRTTEEPNIVFNYTNVFNEIHRYTSFSIYPQRCVDWDWDGEGGPPEKFKEYIMNYRNDFEQKYDFDSGDDGDNDGDDAGGDAMTVGGGGVAEGKTGDLLPLVLYALRF